MAERRPTNRPRPSRLTPEQIKAIADCIATGERHTVIAERFGVSVETVGAIKSGKRGSGAVDEDTRRTMAAAPTGSVLDEAAARRIMLALEAGRPGRSIAEEFGISPSMVSAIKHGQAWAMLDPNLPARLAQMPRRGKALSEQQVAEIKRLMLKGMSTRMVAAEFGVSGSAIQAIAQGKTWSTTQPAENPDDAAAD